MSPVKKRKNKNKIEIEYEEIDDEINEPTTPPIPK